MSRVLRVCPSGYYASLKKGINRRRERDEELKNRIERLFKRSFRRYGSPRIHQDLKSENIRVGKKRVARLMQELNLVARARKRFVRTTDSDHRYAVAPNKLNREFQVTQVAGLNRRWAGDMTYIPTAEGWLYLAVVLDLKSRKVIGWSMHDTMEQILVQTALEMATTHRLTSQKLEKHKEEKGLNEDTLLFHSDRGGQYAGHLFRDQLEESHIECSMSRKGNCWDNAPLESFFATLKTELMQGKPFETRKQARLSLFQYIETFYNPYRRHSALGYLSPADFETSLTD